LKLHTVLFVILRLVLGGIFILAGVPKILHPAAFAEALYNYQILPNIFVNIVAIVMPWVEVVVGGLLVAGVWMEGAILIYNFLVIAFSCALAFNLSRGLDINCGCFSPTGGDVINMGTILRDVLILCLSLYLFYAVYFRKPEKSKSPKP